MNVKWNTLSFWRDNDNNGDNDNIRVGAKYDAGEVAETSFPLTVALYISWNIFTLYFKRTFRKTALIQENYVLFIRNLESYERNSNLFH